MESTIEGFEIEKEELDEKIENLEKKLLSYEDSEE